MREFTVRKETRRRSRKNWKREVRSKYKRIKCIAELEIENATKDNCYIEVKPELRFVTWLVMKKLERKGFTCELEKHDEYSRFFPNDVLFINWEKLENE